MLPAAWDIAATSSWSFRQGTGTQHTHPNTHAHKQKRKREREREAGSSIGADHGSGLMRPLLSPPWMSPPTSHQPRKDQSITPRICHPQWRTDVTTPWCATPYWMPPPCTDIPPPTDVTPPLTCHPSHGCATPPHCCATSAIVRGDCGSEVPWPMFLISSARTVSRVNWSLWSLLPSVELHPIGLPPIQSAWVPTPRDAPRWDFATRVPPRNFNHAPLLDFHPLQ